MADFFPNLDELVTGSTVTIDRRRGHTHPRFPGVVYPLDYGHLDNSRSGDGAEVDVVLGSAHGEGVVSVLLIADPGSATSRSSSSWTAHRRKSSARRFCS